MCEWLASPGLRDLQESLESKGRSDWRASFIREAKTRRVDRAVPRYQKNGLNAGYALPAVSIYGCRRPARHPLLSARPACLIVASLAGGASWAVVRTPSAEIPPE